jgi:hypothetical protein
MKKIAFLFSLPFIFSLAGCFTFSYKIWDQSRPDASVLIMKMNIDSGFFITSGSVQNSSGGEITCNYKGNGENSFRSDLIVADGIIAGKYRIKSLSAETSRTRVGNRISWKELNLRFDNPKEDISAKESEWMTVDSGKVLYFGQMDMVTESNREEYLSKVAAVTKKSRAIVEKAIMGNYTIVLLSKSGKKYTPGFLFRTDHPALIGEKAALLKEKQVIMGFIDRDEEHPLWWALIDKRVAEIDASVSKLK